MGEGDCLQQEQHGWGAERLLTKGAKALEGVMKAANSRSNGAGGVRETVNNRIKGAGWVIEARAAGLGGGGVREAVNNKSNFIRGAR